MTGTEGNKPGQHVSSPKELTYCDLAQGPFDFLDEIVSTMGIRLVRCSADDLNDCEGSVLVNCIGIPPQRLDAKGKRTSLQSLTIVTDVERVEKYVEYGNMVAVPMSYRRSRTICLEASIGAGQSQNKPGPSLFRRT